MRSVDIAVVGAGPAGIAAATEAAQAGASVLVLDEYSQPGGQYYRHPGKAIDFDRDASVFDKAKDGLNKIEKANKAGVDFQSNALVWGAFSDGTITVYRDGQSDVLAPKKIILATGGYERPVAFPGWTLPGVMAAGAAQAMLKGQGVLPGRRILMAGTGPLQIAVAAQLAQAGAHLVGVLEASKTGDLFSSGRRFWGQWGRLGEGVQYWRTLRSAKVPIDFGRTVIRAYGDQYLSRITTAALDDNWSPIPGSESDIDVDTLCLGFGLIPNTRLARLLGCQIAYDPARGGYAPVHDNSMQTTHEGVFVAGEAAGIAGARAAELQGLVAGLSAALQLGKGDRRQLQKRIDGAARELKSELQFAKSLNEVFTPRPGILDLLADDTILCRCEEVTVGQLRNDRPEWMTSLDAARTMKRVGMGSCQGAMCETLVAELLARETGQPISEIGTYHIRPPLRPVPIGVLADLNSSLQQSAEPSEAAAHP